MKNLKTYEQFLNEKKVTVDYLESISGDYCGSGNIHKISKDVFEFTVYNLLPGTNPEGLDGHYSFAVNITNFDYVYWKDSDYGGLTYVHDNENKIFIPVHKSIKKQIEGLIARKLLGAYWYDGNHVNHQGPNLFGNDGYKSSIICTFVDDYPNEPLGQLSEIEKLAVTKLQK